MKQEKITQLFGLSIVKEIDTKTKNVRIEIKSKGQGLPMAEALLLVEGWLKAEKDKMIGPVFKGQNNIVSEE